MNFRIVTVLFLFTVSLFTGTVSIAQDNGVIGPDKGTTMTVDTAAMTLPVEMHPDSNKVPKRRMDQHRDYVNMRYMYPAKPRHWSTISLAGGIMYTSGDVKARPGWQVGLRYRWNLGYVVSMRADFRYGVSFGQNYEAKDLVGSLEENQLTSIHNEAYRRAGGKELEDAGQLVNYANYGIYLAYDNYKNEIADASVSLMFHLNNIKFHREKTFFNFYVFMGIGGMLYRTQIDALYDSDGDGIDDTPYNYVEFLNEGKIFGEVNADLAAALADGIVQADERGVVRDALKELYGGNALKKSYETPAEGHKNEETLFNRVFNPTFHVGAAIDFLVTDRLTIGVETKHTFTNDDLIDGNRWSVQGDLTRDYDTYNQSSITLGINLGSKKKADLPMWWMNPYDRTMFMLQQMPKVAPQQVAVPEEDENKDSDGDGCPDKDDPEPYSTPFLPIKDCINIYDFANKECCDEKATIIPAVPCREIELPSIHFDDDKYYVKPEFYAHLHEIARKMQDCPDLRVVADGHTDTRDDIKYNEQLSWNRVNASINYLVEKYGISRDRFIVKFSGERKPLNPDESAFEKYQNRRVEFRFADEGEEGESNPPAPHPGIKTGGDK